MYDMEILHRDISAGNVLLTETPNGGFLTDLEFACIRNQIIQRPAVTNLINFNLPTPNRIEGYTIPTEATSRTHTRFETTVTDKRGAVMTVSHFYVLFCRLKCFTGNSPIHGQGCINVEGEHRI